MKAGGKADWLVALLIAGVFVFSTRSKAKSRNKIEIITEKGRLYLIDPDEAPLLQAKLSAAGESIRSIRTVTK